jgi:hypothetical protein
MNREDEEKSRRPSMAGATDTRLAPKKASDGRGEKGKRGESDRPVQGRDMFGGGGS